MARYSREATQRAVRAGYIPPLVCAACGQRFWTEEQKRAHWYVMPWGETTRRVCQHAPSGPRP